MFITPADFVGKFELSVGMYSTANIQAYIDRYEKQYLVELFGKKMYDQFIADLDIVTGLPQSPEFRFIFEPFVDDSYFDHYYHNQSKGIKDMLLGFVYFEYTKDLISQMTPFGNVSQNSENSTVESTTYTMIYNRYNEAVFSYRAIQQYIYLNSHTVINGQLVTIAMITAGTNIPSGVYDATGGSGTGATLSIVSDVSGTVESVAIDAAGKNYEVGDLLGVDAGDLNLKVEVKYVGVANYRNFKGRTKETNTWI